MKRAKGGRRSAAVEAGLGPADVEDLGRLHRELLACLLDLFINRPDEVNAAWANVARGFLKDNAIFVRDASRVPIGAGLADMTRAMQEMPFGFDGKPRYPLGLVIPHGEREH